MRPKNIPHTVSAIQPKPVRRPPAAPPVFRPQAVPKVLQTKTQPANQRVSSTKSTPAAPPVYRPQAKKTVQPKMAAAAHTTPAAPPAYRPQPTPKVLQLKSAHTNTGASPKHLSSLPSRRPQPGGRIAPPAVAQLSPVLSRGAGLSQVIQRAKITIGTDTIDTTTMTVSDLVQMANKLYKEGSEASLRAHKEIYAAIEREEVLQDEEEYEGWGEGSGEGSGQVDISDLLAMVETDEPDEADTPSATLLSRGEIIRLHKSCELSAKGFRSDNLTGAISSATREAKIEDKIAVLVWAVVNGHTFMDGNKRTGLLMLQEMAGKNGKTIHGDPQPILLDAAKHAAITEVGFKAAITKILTAL